MASETIEFKYAASANIYIRVWNSASQVLDFDDDTFKAIGSATTPYLACSETAGLYGTGQSRYAVSLDLSKVNTTGAASTFIIYAYDNASPASTDNPVSDVLELPVQFSQKGHKPLYVMYDNALDGSDVKLFVWLERDGQVVDIDGADSSCTCSVTVREHESGSNLFVKNGTNADLRGDVFELTQASPGYTDDKLYEVTATITENSITHSNMKPEVAIG